MIQSLLPLPFPYFPASFTKVLSVISRCLGLPITLAAALIIVARRLAKKGLYMKRLDVAETLGTATVVMCDKRGVFTSSDITVTDVWHDRMFFRGECILILN